MSIRSRSPRATRVTKPLDLAVAAPGSRRRQSNCVLFDSTLLGHFVLGDELKHARTDGCLCLPEHSSLL